MALRPIILKRARYAFNRLLSLNPQAEESHQIADFVIENFMDMIPGAEKLEIKDVNLLAAWFIQKRRDYLTKLKEGTIKIPYTYPGNKDGKPMGNMESICWDLIEEGLDATIRKNGPNEFPDEIRPAVIRYEKAAKEMEDYITAYTKKHNIHTEY